MTAQERRDERRERLLDAGLEQFAMLGYAATTIDGLCAAASLNARYFYEQFRNREELLLAVYERHVDAVQAKVLLAMDAAASGERLAAGLRAFVEATLADERGARIDYFEIIGVSADLERLRRRRKRGYAEMVLAEGDFTQSGDADPRVVAVALVGAVDGLIIDWLSGERTTPLETIVQTLLLVFSSVIR